MALVHVPGAPWWHSTDVSIVPVPQHARRDSKNPAFSIEHRRDLYCYYSHASTHLTLAMPCHAIEARRNRQQTESHTGVGGVLDEVEERLVDVEDDELEVGVPALHGVRGHAELPVEGEGVVVEALHAARAPAAEQGHGRRETPHRRQRRHADPAGAQVVQALQQACIFGWQRCNGSAFSHALVCY